MKNGRGADSARSRDPIRPTAGKYGAATMNFRSVEALNLAVISRLHTLGELDCVVAVPRSGLVPATLVALYRNVELFPSPETFETDVAIHGSTRLPRVSRIDGGRRRVLVVDDSCNTGGSMSAAVESVRRADPAAAVESFVVYATSYSTRHVDRWCEVVDQPRVFEWNLLHHPQAGNFGFDLDGIFCPDPPASIDPDGEEMAEFYRTAPVRIAPTYPVGAIITSRTYEHEGVTRDWLADHSIGYGEITFFPGSSQVRRALGLHAAHKARVYAASDLELFVESEPSQAYEIQRITGRPVLCWSERRSLHVESTSGPASLPRRVMRAARRRIGSPMHR